MARIHDLEIFCNAARETGALDAVVVSPREGVVTADWVRMRCQYGCSEYGRCLTCPPYSPAAHETRKMLDEFSAGILLHGDRTEPLRQLARRLERDAFLAGYHKAFAFLCGPCRLCRTCAIEKPSRRRPRICRHAELARPAMEAAGIDVFATARQAGMPIEVVASRDCPQDYYALVLLE